MTEQYKEEIQFLDALKEADSKKEELAEKVKELPKNDWKGLCTLGKENKFKVTVEGLKTTFPGRFYKDTGWDIPSEKKQKK